jgi:glycosyltransferase involved in cell wall biosynthesis
MVPGYRIPVLEKLNERLDGRLVVCAGLPPSTSSFNFLMPEEKKGFRSIALKNRWLFGERMHAQPFRRVFREIGDPAVVLAEESPRSVTLPFLLRHAHKCGAGRVLWGHFSSLKRQFDPKRHPQDRYRVALARHVEACACYTPGVAELLRPYVPEENLFVARNTIDMGQMFEQYDLLAAEGKDAVRRRLSLRTDVPVLAYLGRLIPEKGTAMLLETFARLRADTPAELLIIGDGPERSAMESYVASHAVPGVRFLGSLFEGAAPYLFASDVMLVPGYLGLVINHSFAFGLPIVSMRKPIGMASHSPEVEYVRSGENGLLCEGVDAEDLHRGVKTVLGDQHRFSTNALRTARNELTVDQMLDGLHDAIQHAALLRLQS